MHPHYRLDVEPICEEEKKVASVKLKEAGASFGRARGSSESVHEAVRAENRAEGKRTGALAVEVEVPPTAVTHQAHNAVTPSIVLTAPDEEDYELFPSCTTSPVSTTSVASNAISGSSLVHSRLSLPSRSPPASCSPPKLSISPDPPSPKLTVHSTSISQPLASPYGIGSILEEPIPEEEMIEQCFYDYSGGDGGTECITQFSPRRTGEKGDGSMSSLVAIPKDSQNENINLFKRSEPATRNFQKVHMEDKPRAMSLPMVHGETTHGQSLLWNQLNLPTKTEGRELTGQTPESVVCIEVVCY